MKEGGCMEEYTKEFKIDIPQKQKALKAEIVSFLNSTNGEIYLGIDDSGSIQYDLIEKKRKCGKKYFLIGL